MDVCRKKDSAIGTLGIARVKPPLSPKEGNTVPIKVSSEPLSGAASSATLPLAYR